MQNKNLNTGQAEGVPVIRLPHWQTPRCVLRLPEPSDLETLSPIYADPDVMRFIGNGEARTPEQVRSSLQWMIEQHDLYGYGLWIVQEKNTGDVIGRCGLICQTIDDQPEVEIAYMLAKPYWRKGLASEIASAIYQRATQTLKLNRLIALIHPDNIASQQVANKTGLRFERKVKLGDITANLFSNTQAAPLPPHTRTPPQKPDPSHRNKQNPGKPIPRILP